MNDPESFPRVTLKDIAKVVGVSHGAVSLALRNSSQVSKETCRRVQAAAREMGYRPNAMAAGLAHFKRTSTVKPVQAALGWMNSWGDPEQLRSFREFDNYWAGAAACAQKFGYRLDEFVYRDLGSFSRLEEVLQARGIRGILIPPGELGKDWSDFHWERISVAGLGRRDDGFPCHTITSDQLANTMLAFEAVRERGYKRIGFVGSRHKPRLFGAGFLWIREIDERACRLPPLYFGDDRAANERALSQWLKKAKPDAIVTERAELLGMLEKVGCRVPDDIGVAALSVLDCPIDAGIYQNPEEIGRVALLVLMSLINDNERGLPSIPREVLVSGNWVDGSSLPRR